MQLDSISYNAISQNSILFLKKAISQLIKDGEVNKPLIKEDAVFSSIYIQIALELAAKAIIIKKVGFSSILDISKHNKDSEEDLLEKFNNNDIKVKEFDGIKNFIMGNKDIFGLDKNEIAYIEKFQKYRNKLVHLNYNFSPSELNDLRKDLIFVIVHIVIKFLAEREDTIPSEFYMKHLDHGEFNNLIDNELYRKEMAEYAKQFSSEILYCPICSNDSLLPEEKYCYTCLSLLDDDSCYGFLNCDYCGAENSVIYDRLNIHNNKHIIKGLCLNCKDDAFIYECPKCHICYNIETSAFNLCKNGICINAIEED